MQSEQNNYYLRRWAWVLLGAPAWWVLGLNLVVFHLTAFVLFLALVHDAHRRGHSLYVPKTAMFLAVLISIYLFSLILNGISADVIRVIASAYNLSYWVMGFCLIMVFSNVFRVCDINLFLRTFIFFAIPVSILLVVTLVLLKFGIKDISFHTPLFGLTKYLGNNLLVENSLSVKMLYFEWFASTSFPRFNFYSPYAVAGGEIMMMVLSLILAHITIHRKKFKPLYLILFVLCFFAMLMTLSRITFMSFLFAYGIIFLIRKKYKLIWMLLAILAAALCYPLIDKAFVSLWNLREGSNSYRLEIYKYSVQLLLDTNFLTGYGVKPRDINIFGVPVGSHSTYISVLFRTGIAGFIALMAFKIDIFISWYRMRNLASRNQKSYCLWQSLGMIFIAMGVCMLTEDIDVPQLVCFLYFSCVGVFEGLRKNLKGT